MFTEQEKEVLTKIGEFFLLKNNQNYAETEIQLRKMQITDILVTKERITVTLRRPGLLFGVRGRLITELQEYLGVEVAVVEAQDRNLYEWLIPIRIDVY